MENQEYRCQECDYLFDDLMSPVVDAIECPICGGETIWVLGQKKNVKIDDRSTTRRRTNSLPLFDGIIHH